jgi:hypothetical protein
LRRKSLSFPEYQNAESQNLSFDVESAGRRFDKVMAAGENIPRS